jgi:steroid delta-isomerase-like uncharacterized protein
MMTRSEISEFFALRERAWQNHDAETLATTHAQDGEIESPMFGILEGQSAIRKSYIDLLSTFPDMIFSSEYLLIDGDRVALFLKLTGTQQRDFCGLPATGKRMQIRGTSLYFMADGKISKEIRSYDFTGGVLMQLGVLKAKPAF